MIANHFLIKNSYSTERRIAAMIYNVVKLKINSIIAHMRFLGLPLPNFLLTSSAVFPLRANVFCRGLGVAVYKNTVFFLCGPDLTPVMKS